MEARGTRLIKRGGVWYVVWTGNTRGRSTGTGSREEAERFLATFIQEGNRKQAVSAGLTIHQAIDDYVLEHRQNTASGRNEHVADYFRLHFPVDMLVADLREEDIDDPKTGRGYIQRRRNSQIVLKRANPRPAADGTLRYEIGFLAAAFAHAARKRRVSKADILTMPRPASPPPKDRWLTAEEERELIEACTVELDGRLTKIYRFLMLALETAARKEAIETLTWFQVDFGAGTIDFNPPGRKHTKKRRAVVRMSTRLRAVLERSFREKTSGWVLDNASSVRNSFELLVARSGLLDVTPHTLRHTWATRAAQAGVKMREIADWLGDNIATVERVYYKRSPDYLKDAIDWREREQRPATDRATIVPKR